MPNWGGYCQPHLNTGKIRYLVLASGACMEVIYSPEGLACGNPLCILPLCSYQYLSRYSRVRWPHKSYTEDGSLCDLRLADVYMFQRISGVGGKMSPWKIRKQMLNQNHDPCLYVHALWTCRRLTRTQVWKRKHIDKSSSWQLVPKEPLEPEGLTHSLSYPQIEQLLEANHFQWSVKNYLVGVNFSVHGFKLPGLGGCLSLPQQTLQGTMR